MISIIKERMARKISPALFVLVGFCFFLPFLSVSCSSAGASALSGIDASGSAANSSSAVCLNGDLLTYSGVDMVKGAEPSPPAACNSGSSSGASSSDPFKIGWQPYGAAAAVLILLGFILGGLRLRSRSVLTALAALFAGILLLINQWTVTSIIKDAINQATQQEAGGGGIKPPEDVTSFLNFNTKIGLIVALVLLGLIALYNFVVFASDRGSGSAASLALPTESPPALV